MQIVKTKAIPVMIGATGTISYSFRKYMNNVPGKHENKGATENSHTRHCTHTHTHKHTHTHTLRQVLV